MTDDLQYLNPVIELIFRFGERSLLQWCDQNPQMVTQDLARALHLQGTLVVGEQDFKTAKHLFFQSSVVWKKLGLVDREINERVFYLDCLFQLTSDPYDYKNLARRARELLKKCRDAEYLDLAFCLATLEAECWWFAGREEKQAEVETCLKVLNRMPRLAEVGAVRLRGWFERFISLGASVCEIFFAMPDTEEKAGLFSSKMKILAQKIEVQISDGFSYQVIPAETGPVVVSLARLMEQTGKDDLAHFLLAQEARRCDESGQSGEVVHVLGLRHVMAAHSDRLTPQRKADIREDLFESLSAIRNVYRSRAGRLYNAGMMEQYLADTLREFVEKGSNAGEAFALIEYTKAQTLLERVNGHFLPAEREDSGKVHELESKLLYTSAKADAGALLVSKNDLALWHSDADKNIRKLEQIYRRGKSGFSSTVQAFTIDRLRQCLRDDELVLEIVVPHNLMYPTDVVGLLAIDKKRCEFINLQKELQDIEKSWKGLIGFVELEREQGIGVSPMNDLVYRTRAAILSGQEQIANDCLAQTGKLMLEPLKKAGFLPEDYRCWHFVPSRALHNLPYAALRDEKGKYLIERVAVTVAPSAAVWADMTKRMHANAANRALAYGNPTIEDDALPPLKNAEKEVDRIAGILSSADWKVKTGGQASEAHFKRHAPGHQIIHVASHGVFPQENAMDFHGILLSPSSDQDGVLRADEIYDLHLEGTRLFVLSICNGSLYRFGPGDEPFGIIPALIAAGTANIVGTLWPLEDAIGRQTMVDFYRALRKDDPAQALRKAACLLIEAGAAVRHWAAFVLCGSGRGRVKKVS